MTLPLLMIDMGVSRLLWERVQLRRVRLGRLRKVDEHEPENQLAINRSPRCMLQTSDSAPTLTFLSDEL